MKITIFGGGCTNCLRLEENIKKALETLGKTAIMDKVSDIDEILRHGIMTTPALAINGQVKIVGRVPTPEKIAEILKEYL